VRPLYVETLIRTDPESLWRASQDPRRHERWDARFTRIDQLDAGTFRYATRVLPGVVVTGLGVTAGERHRPDGCGTSALRFGSDDPRSLIRSGSGYWRYVPGPGGIRFLTGYDYEVRWGRLGRVADVLFRPFFGWATAWSFDRLRLWLERGEPPERARWYAIAEAAGRGALVAVAASSAPGWLVVFALALAVGLPPGPRTPAARRCRRRARDTRPPAILSRLESAPPQVVPH
jgi:hypothetical protein